VTARSPRPRVLGEGKRARAAAPRTAAHVAPSAMLRPRSAMDVSGVLAQLADLHAQLGQVYGRLGILHEVEPASDSAQDPQVPLEDPPERALMGRVETTPGTPLQGIQLDYLADLRLRVSERHYAGVRARLERVIGAMNGTPAEELKPLQVLRFRNEMEAAGASARTVDTYVGAFQACLNWAVEMGVIPSNPVARVKRLAVKKSTPRYRRRALSDDEIARFLSASREDDYDQQFNARCDAEGRIPQTPLWQTLLETGARWNEARQLVWGDVDLDGRILVLRPENTKSKKSRAIPLREELVVQIRQLAEEQADYLGRDPSREDRVFLTPEGMPWAQPTTNAGRIFHRVLAAAGIARKDADGRKIDIHALRHSFGSRLARNGVSLVKTQRLMGHSDPKLTESVYTHLDAEDLRDAVEAMG